MKSSDKDSDLLLEYLKSHHKCSDPEYKEEWSVWKGPLAIIRENTIHLREDHKSSIYNQKLDRYPYEMLNSLKILEPNICIKVQYQIHHILPVFSAHFKVTEW